MNSDFKYQDLNGQELSFDKMNGKFHLNSKDLESHHDIISTSSIIALEERHSITPIHTEMFFYCQRIIHTLLDRNQEIIFSAVYDALYEDIKQDIRQYLTQNSSITIDQLNAYIHSQREKYCTWARTAIVVETVGNNGQLKNTEYLSEDMIAINLQQDAYLNQLKQTEENQVLGLSTEANGLPYQPNKDPILAVKLEQRALANNNLLQECLNRSPFETQQGNSVSAQLGELMATISKNQATPHVSLSKVRDDNSNHFFPTHTPLYLSTKPLDLEETLENVHNSNLETLRKEAQHQIQKITSPFIDVICLSAKYESRNSSYFFSTAADEIRLLTDLSILRSLMPFIPIKQSTETRIPPWHSNLADIDLLYAEFLINREGTDDFFCDYVDNHSDLELLIQKTKNNFITCLEYVPKQEDVSPKHKLALVLAKLYRDCFIDNKEDAHQYGFLIQALHMTLNDKHGYERTIGELPSEVTNLSNLLLAYSEDTIPTASPLKTEMDKALGDFISNTKPTNLEFKQTILNINKKYNAHGSAINASISNLGVPNKKLASEIKKMAAAVNTLNKVKDKPKSPTQASANPSETRKKEAIITALQSYKNGHSWFFFSWRHHKADVSKMLEQLSSENTTDESAISILTQYQTKIRHKEGYKLSGAMEKTFTRLNTLGIFSLGPTRANDPQPSATQKLSQ